ncbi:hypothetical protein BKA82DRAFT_75908, partial [Pisolithus tinctorius]
AWNIAPWKQIFHHKLRTHIGHAAFSSDTKCITLTNLSDGVDIYSPGQSHPNMHLKNHPLTEDQNIPVQVSWLFDGAAIVSGSSDGGVHVWTASSGELLQLLEH